MIYRFLQEGGFWMIPILGVSVVGTTFVLERAWFWFVLWLRRDMRLRRRLLRGELPGPGTRTRDPQSLECFSEVASASSSRPDLGILPASSRILLL